MTRTDLAPLGRLRPMRAVLLGTVFAGLAATGALAETLTVTGLTGGDAQLYKVTIPSIEIVDGNLVEADIRTIFQGAAGAWDKLAGLDAKSVTIPEITVSSAVEGSTAAAITYTYHDIVLTDVVDGVAQSAAVASTEMSGAELFTGTFGEMAAKQFDIGGLLGFYGFTTPSEPTDELKQVYADLTFAGGTLAGGDMFSCTIGAAEAAGFSARPLRTNIGEIQSLILEADAAQTAGTPLEPEKIKQLVLFYTDLLTAFSSTPMSFDGFSCSGKDDKGQPMTINAGTMSIDGFEPAIYPQFGLSDLVIDITGDQGGHVNLGNFTWKKMDFSTAIEVLESAATMDEAFFAANWRKLIPVMDGFSLAGLDIDVPNPEMPSQRSVASLGSFDATLGNYINGIPADIALKLVNLVVPVTEDMKDVPVAELKARGITSLDISLGTDLAWDAATSTIEVSDVLIDLGQLGQINFSGTFGNASEALFSDNTDEAMQAAMLMTLKDITINVQDRGIGSFLVAAGAKDAGQTEESFRTAIAGMAQGMTMAFLGNSTEALTAAQQLGLFLQGSSNLTMTITANDEAGIGLADLAALETNPTVLAGKITVTAEASGEPVTLPLVDGAGTVQDQKRDLKAPATN